MPQKFIMHTDPGHGWLEVPTEQVRALGVAPTAYSYQDKRKGLSYLEEDLDAQKFLNAYREKFGHTPEIESVHVDYSHPIRELKWCK